MDSRFSSDFFAANRQRLRALFTGRAPIVITANGLLQRGGDCSYPFSQDANFWYLTGIDEPDIVLVMDKDKEYLIVPARDTANQAFNGTLQADTLSRRSGITAVYDDEDGWEQLAGRLKKVKHVATIAAPPAYGLLNATAMYTNPARANLIQKLKSYNSQILPLDLGQHMVRLRMVKQPEELAALQDAIDITIAGLRNITKPAKLARYANEYELDADLTREFRRRGANGTAFMIIAGGPRAVTLHYEANNQALSADELLVLDVGADVEHYAADITRTVAIGQPSRRQQAVYQAVAEVQDYAFSLLKPGVLLKDYEQAIEHFMGEKLRELGLIKSISHEEVRRYFPHATSHFLGLNVHDVGDYQRPLEPGMVLTVEPGIYIPDESIGVRIEDDVLITARGHKVLSQKLPRLLQ